MRNSKIVKKLQTIGPAALVTAAFIGPGTITTCSIAGAKFGFALLWGLLFSVIATIVLQEMSARLGIVTRKGLGEALREQAKNPLTKFITAFLVLSAIVIGNAAYETGNILGGALGLETITGISKLSIGTFSINIWGPVIGIFAFILMIIGSYKTLEKMLITLVILMSFAFISTTIVIAPNIGSILKGVFVPSFPKGSVLTLVALIGTTVVPYNLFLHASAVQERWKDQSGLKAARTDIFISIALGGLISMSIVITSAAAFMGTGTEIKGAADMAMQLQPLLGSWAKIFMAFGLFAAGVSSAVTAPLAASYAAAGILGWKKDLRDEKFRAVWIFILMIGIVFSAIGFKPIQVIVFAQVTNGILLPIIAVYLIWVMNSKKILGDFRNNLLSNITGGTVVLIAIGLGIRSILSVIGII
ncbi:MAG: Nramp family divalent metal transporter [Bacteroidales bacterium]|nr:Nramp family divalent metal transporter [Bacteroidales bacterium]